MTKNLPYRDPSGRLPARGCGNKALLAMVYGSEGSGLSATTGAASLNLSADIAARLFIAVLNQIHSRRPISLKKKSFTKNHGS